MSNVIKITFISGSAAYVNWGNVLYVEYTTNGFTIIHLVGGSSFQVKESPNDLISQLREID